MKYSFYSIRFFTILPFSSRFFLLGMLLFLMPSFFLLSGCSGQAGQINKQAVQYLEQGKILEAVTLLEKAQQMAPERHEISLNLAEGYYRLGQLNSALEATRVAYSLAPNNPDVLVKRAKIRLGLGQADSVLKELDKSGAAESKNPQLRFYYGLALETNGQPEAAIEHLKFFLDKHSNSAKANAALGKALLETGQFSEGKRRLERARQIRPDLVESHLYLARYYMNHAGDYIKARDILYEARRANAQHPQLLLMLGNCHLATGMLPEANRVFEEALMKNPDSWEAYLGLADVARRRNNMGVALDFARQARDKAPRQPEVHNFLGGLYEARNQTTLAIQSYRQSLELEPEQPEIKTIVEKYNQS
jgi:tetratricopeptide (TPR) repeat protein